MQRLVSWYNYVNRIGCPLHSLEWWGSVEYLLLTQLLRSQELLEFLRDTMMLDAVNDVNAFPGDTLVHSLVWPFLDQGVYFESTAASDSLRHLLMRDAEQTEIIITGEFLRGCLQERKEYCERHYGVCFIELCRKH
jgi:hypothetical protein